MKPRPVRLKNVNSSQIQTLRAVSIKFVDAPDSRCYENSPASIFARISSMENGPNSWPLCDTKISIPAGLFSIFDKNLLRVDSEKNRVTAFDPLR
jgi:hypothetical protein